MPFFFYLGIPLLLAILYLYMVKRMSVMVKAQKNNSYRPNMILSFVELIVFVSVYVACSVMASYKADSMTVVLVSSLVAFIISLFVINKTLFFRLGWYLVIVAVAAQSVFFALVYYIVVVVMA